IALAAARGTRAGEARSYGALGRAWNGAKIGSMSSSHQRLAEGLPERHPAGKNSFQAEAKALKSWIDALPMANPSAADRLLFNALRELNQLRVDPATRLAAMESLRGP